MGKIDVHDNSNIDWRGKKVFKSFLVYKSVRKKYKKWFKNLPIHYDHYGYKRRPTITWHFTETGIGTSIIVIAKRGNKLVGELDLSEYHKW